MTGAGSTSLTLGELVEQTGVSARTVRYYTTRGLLPSPIRHGREVRYGEDHVVRLQLVRELQEYGLTLTAIERYVARVPTDASPATIELHRTMLAPWGRSNRRTMTRADLEAQAGRRLTRTDLDVLAALDVATPHGRGRFDVDTDGLTAGLAICRLDVTPEAAGTAHRVITTHGAAAAVELAEVFREQVWPAMRDSGASPEELRAVVEQFKPLTAAALLSAYESAMDDTRRATVERRAATD